MTRILASAPGKVVLSGEYAVLDGAPAVSMAVDRRATAVVVTGTDGVCSVSAPGYASEPARFVVDAGRFRWLEDGDRFAVVEKVWRAAAFDMCEACEIVLDTRAFTDAETCRKIGVGSSAAVTVALAAAVNRVAGEAVDVSAVALEAHRELQGGGSGVDIATAMTGGLVEYRMAECQCRPLDWPAELHFALYWSGVAADTAQSIERLASVASRPSRNALADAAERAAAAWQAGAGAAILEALRDFTHALRRFDVDHDIGIFDAGHGTLAAAAPDDVVYKPCGAGGGDIGAALATDARAIEAFTAIARRQGFRHLPIALDPNGVLSRRGPE